MPIAQNFPSLSAEGLARVPTGVRLHFFVRWQLSYVGKHSAISSMFGQLIVFPQTVPARTRW